MFFSKVIHQTKRSILKFQSKALIILYHRVEILNSDPQLLTITPKNFKEHLEHISEYYNPMSLSGLYNSIQKKKIPDKSVIITFDDGYADNFMNAKPLLEKYNVPATVFVASGYTGGNKEFWWDELERLLLLPENLSDYLEININGTIYTWDLTSEASELLNGVEIDLHSWNVTMDNNPGLEYQVYRDLHRILKPLSHEMQQHILDEIAQWAGLSREGRSTHLPLDCSQLKQLEHGGLVEVGAHTVNHPMLSAHSQQVQEKEIFDNKKYLEDILDHDVNTFSYPFGGKADFNNQTLDIVRKCGFGLACANYSGSVTRYTSPYKLPRHLVRNWDVDLFSRKLGEWFDE